MLQVNAKQFYQMMANASAQLERESDSINNLNVFPVPDGDTGSNMSRTMEGVSQFDGMVILNNLSQTYYTRNDMVFQDLDDALYQMLLRYKENGSGIDYAVVDSQDVTDDDFYNAVRDNMEKAGQMTEMLSRQWDAEGEALQEQLRRFCTRKWNSTFSEEMSRSCRAMVADWLED